MPTRTLTPIHRLALAGAASLLALGLARPVPLSAQNLYVSNYDGSYIEQYPPTGARARGSPAPG